MTDDEKADREILDDVAWRFIDSKTFDPCQRDEAFGAVTFAYSHVTAAYLIGRLKQKGLDGILLEALRAEQSSMAERLHRITRLTRTVMGDQ
jgi:hypothetical protein